jgi:hypothetical protein
MMSPASRGCAAHSHTRIVREDVTFGCHNGVVQDGSMEGWYTDPYQRHEARWMSQGTPTWQVKDGDVEGRDDPLPDEPFKVTPVRIDAEGPFDGSDQRRADDAQTEEPYDSREASRAAWDVFDQSLNGP